MEEKKKRGRPKKSVSFVDVMSPGKSFTPTTMSLNKPLTYEPDRRSLVFGLSSRLLELQVEKFQGGGKLHSDQVDQAYHSAARLVELCYSSNGTAPTSKPKQVKYIKALPSFETENNAVNDGFSSAIINPSADPRYIPPPIVAPEEDNEPDR